MPASIPVYTDANKETPLVHNTWNKHNNLTSIYADWSGATEPAEESGIEHYYVYLGTDNTANPITAGVDKGLATEGVLTLPPNPTSNTYYLRVTVADYSGNLTITPSGSSLFNYKYDNEKPANPTYVSVSPLGWSTQDNFTFTWPTANDSGTNSSNVTSYQYRKASGDDITWHDVTGTTAAGVTSYQDGRNELYVRSVDDAGNIADNYTFVYYYYNGTGPSAPTNLAVVPPNAVANNFTFTWSEPITHNDLIKGYYYSVNSEPDINNTVYTTALTTGLIPAAPKQGFNIFYVVAVDESDQINWGSYEQVTFECNTPAPGIPGGVVISDSSNRGANDWVLTINWKAPEGIIAKYNIYRSTDGTSYSKIAEVGGDNTVFSNSGLSNTSTYYYKITAVDNAGAESAFSSTVSKQPTGKFTEPL